MTATEQLLKMLQKHFLELQWFTDQTSYNLTDMIDKTSRRPASGEKEINKLLLFIEGFALAAAKAGVGAQTTSRASPSLNKQPLVATLLYED